VRQETEDELAAARHLQEALDIHQDAGHRLGEAITLGYLGRMHLRRGEYPAAAQHLHEALGISVRSVTGTAKWVSSTTATRFRQALTIFQRTGAAESARVAAELNALTSTPGEEPGQTRTR
jgi:hypothetical protein